LTGVPRQNSAAFPETKTLDDLDFTAAGGGCPAIAKATWKIVGSGAQA
jgi:hypothetical protein